MMAATGLAAILGNIVLAAVMAFGCLSRVSGVESEEQGPSPLMFRLCAAYFFGVAAFLTVWRITALFLGSASMALALTVALLVVANFGPGSLIQSQTVGNFLLRNRYQIGLLLLFVVVTQGFWWIFDTGQINCWTNMGSLHTGRYSNISQFIFQNNKIPIIGQNSDQALLASIMLFVGMDQSVLSLCVWNGMSSVALMVLFYAIFTEFGFVGSKAKWATLLVIFGTASLSLHFVRVFDAESPIGLSGYSDATRSVGSFCLLLMVIVRSNRLANVSRSCWFILALVAMGWATSGPQNFLLTSAVLVVALVFARKDRHSQKRIIGVLVTLFVLFSVSKRFGGMLSPLSIRHSVNIAGLNNTFQPPGWHSWVIEPYVPRFDASRSWKSVPRNSTRLEWSVLKVMRFDAIPPQWFVNCLKEFLIGLRIIFFPVLGYGLLGILCRKTEDKKLKMWWTCSLTTFLVPATFVFVATINGQRWELSRFMMVGYTLGIFNLVLSIQLIGTHLQSRSRLASKAVLWTVTSICLLAVPARTVARAVLENVFHPSQLKKRIEIVLTTTGDILCR